MTIFDSWENFQTRANDLGPMDSPMAANIWYNLKDGCKIRGGDPLVVSSPIDGKPIASIPQSTRLERDLAVSRAEDFFLVWRKVPAPKRGELIRRFGNALRRNKEDLAWLVTAEMGKPMQESLGEVQEMIDICDFAVGLSRQLHGLQIASERTDHRLQETWHPLGPVLVISAFNFPVAVWAWNFTLAIVCGNPVIWKPSEKTPLTAIMCHKMFQDVADDAADIGANLGRLSQLLIGGAELGKSLVDDKSIKLVSATGSTRMGNAVGVKVAERFGKSLLELGGNNAMIVTRNANMKQALTAAVFSAVGTTGQRCTSLRRLFVQGDGGIFYKEFVAKLAVAYATTLQWAIGNPMAPETLVGPLIDKDAVAGMQKALVQAVEQGGTILFGGDVRPTPGGTYVTPAIVEMPEQTEIVKEETFAPILYVMKYKTLDEAIALQNDVDQGLSSSIFTQDMREAEQFLSAAGSDCGIANVNVGTSGAEIGGAFGGEKHTGGGRESGSDAWKNYMRRQTATINYGDPFKDAELAQGIDFKLVEPT